MELKVKRMIYYEVGNVCYLIFPETRMKVIDTVDSRLRVITPHGHDILVTVNSGEEWASVE